MRSNQIKERKISKTCSGGFVKHGSELFSWDRTLLFAFMSVVKNMGGSAERVHFLELIASFVLKAAWME